MNPAKAEVLTPKEVARRIFNVSAPSDQQVSQVIALMKSGEIERTSPQQWSTTVPAVAEYLTRMEAARLDPRDRPVREMTMEGAGPTNASVTGFYRGLIRDYMLAVLLKRKVDSRSENFHRVVLVSQVLFLLVGLLVIGLAVSQALQRPWISPEQKIVQIWLDSKFTEVKIHSVTAHPTQPNAVLAKYVYRDGGRLIESKMKFTLANGQVVSVDSGE
jgi:hypothetical protein